MLRDAHQATVKAKLHPGKLDFSAKIPNYTAGVIVVADNTGTNKDKFFYPVGRYYGEFTPEYLAFNANLQEFTQRVSIICGLEAGGKISPQAAYEEIRTLWKQLKASKQNLLDQQYPPQVELPDGD